MCFSHSIKTYKCFMEVEWYMEEFNRLWMVEQLLVSMQGDLSKYRENVITNSIFHSWMNDSDWLSMTKCRTNH